MRKYYINIGYLLKGKYGRFLKFCIVGGIGSLVSLIILYLLVEYLSFNKYLGWLIGLVLGLASNFILNSLYTWSDRKTNSKTEIIRRLIKYYTLYAIIIVVNYFFYFLFNTLGLYYILSAFFSIVICALINFYFANSLIWKNL